MSEQEPARLDGPPTTLYSGVCLECRHFIFIAFPDGKNRCGAFPDGIPSRIWEGEDLHRKSVPGDHGITFAPRIIRG